MPNLAILLGSAIAILFAVYLVRRIGSNEPRKVPSDTTRDPWIALRIVSRVLIASLCIGFLVWVWWALWGNHQSGASHPDRWLNVATGVGALVAAAGVLVGGFFVARYGRRASVSISALAHPNPVGVVIAARPSVKAVGVFQVRFREKRGAVVRVTEMFVDTAGTPRAARTYEEEDVFGEAFVEGGEELISTILFPVPSPTAAVIGWRVDFEIRAANRFLPGEAWSWTDQVFVPRPLNGQS